MYQILYDYLKLKYGKTEDTYIYIKKNVEKMLDTSSFEEDRKLLRGDNLKADWNNERGIKWGKLQSLKKTKQIKNHKGVCQKTRNLDWRIKIFAQNRFNVKMK